ncbi:hypothetical protein MBAV_005378 [Candidatus Magnetobacterium bavaricum]|uniref:Uncharacterized protein n=1 Tax=Candidatus Magnetobacterium bavaricum TaxID=29290 RepID=A0A0F3GKE8_9BACT|nr:hypothetical protein MBAV_005378 [Candidatus Magnetobacterium bavaricum]
MIRGTAGIGKSCIVGKLAERFKDKELVVFHGVVSRTDVILKLRNLFDRLGNKDGLAILKSDDEYAEKIKAVLRKVFKEQVSAIIYFDDFEQNLDRHGNQHKVKPEAVDVICPFLEAIDWTAGKSSVVITSRYSFILEHNGENLPATKLDDITIKSFVGADLRKKKRNLEFISKSENADLYIKYGYGNPRLLEWLDVIAKYEAKYNLYDIKAKLEDRQEDFINEYLAGVIAETESKEFHKFIQKAAVYKEPVDATAFEAFGGAQFLDTGVDLTLLEREELGRGEFVYWVTPVIREGMWFKLTPDEMDAMHKHAYQWYDSWISEAGKSNYTYMEEAVHHALALCNIRDACKHAHVLWQYFDRMVLYREGQAIMRNVAIRVSESVIDEAKANKDGNVSMFLNDYALSLFKLGDSKQAIAFQEKALAIRLEIHGEKHPDVAASYNDIGSCWKQLGDVNQSMVFHNKALDIHRSIYGERHQSVAISYNNIGNDWKILGDASNAIVFYEKALDIKLEVEGEKHPSVATSYNNIGMAWDMLGNAKQAFKFHQKALEIRLENYGERHPETAQSYNNIGLAWDMLGNAKKAIEHLEKALDIFRSIYGEKHPSVATSYNNIGFEWYTLGDAKQAFKFYQKALDIRVNIYEGSHPETAQYYNNIGLALDILGDSKQAIEYLEKALAMWLEIYGEKHPYIAQSYKNLAVVCLKTVRVLKAIKYFIKSKKAWP